MNSSEIAMIVLACIIVLLVIFYKGPSILDYFALSAFFDAFSGGAKKLIKKS